MKPSEQKYDWLGHGIYFWEGNPGRALDCAVMNTLHAYRDSRKEPAYDSVRGPFLEGNPIYPVAGFRSENHIQLCVLNTECIKGYFRPLRAEVGTLAA
ncbi:hypothetical protein [Candidimonas humi]|uniref:hypothetical protein n=1 Tax=Candidimonas humi TaxID=683355 RepID=UPI001FE55F1E|nr:hypothetical protein [Candidimonas humi]